MQLNRFVSVAIDKETQEKIHRSCAEPGVWRDYFTHTTGPAWSYTQELGDSHLADFNVYTPSSGSEDDLCWCEAVVFERQPDSDMLSEVNCILADSGPFDAPWMFEFDDKSYEVRFC
jgi:hypothetical protein